MRLAAQVVSLSAAILLVACAKTPAPSATAAGVMEIQVDSSGFVPAHLTAPVNQELKLRVTRTTDQTCATEIVIKDLGISKPLPLNQPVEVTFTPTKKGDLRFACAMDMIAGTIHVQ